MELAVCFVQSVAAHVLEVAAQMGVGICRSASRMDCVHAPPYAPSDGTGIPYPCGGVCTDVCSNWLAYGWVTHLTWPHEGIHLEEGKIR